MSDAETRGDHDLPELPSDEQLGIGGREEETRKQQGAKPSKHAWIGPFTLLALVGLVYLTSGFRSLPDSVALSAPDSVFASGRAMLDVSGIARRPHPPGSPEHARVRAYLIERLEELGLEPEVQVATTLTRSTTRVDAATVRNILARIPGRASTGAVLFTAHYDSRMGATGAGDAAAGVAAILETIRVLRTGPPLRNDVIVLLTDGEELGLMGSRAFVREHPWMDDVAVVLSVEMRGSGGPSLMFETGSENGWIIDALDAGDPDANAWSFFTEVYRRLPNDTDFSPFRDRGVQGLNFAAIANAHVYHQRYDEPARLEEATVQHHGNHLMGVSRVLGEADLADVDAPDAAYLPIPILGLVDYPPAVGYALSAVLLLLAVGVGVLLRREGGRVLGVLVGLGVGIATVLATGGIAHLGFPFLAARHPEYMALQGSAFHEEGWYLGALAFLAVAVTVLLMSLVRGRFGLGALTLGALVLPLAGAVALPFVAPLAAPNLQWPTLLALVGAGTAAGVAPGTRTGLLRWAILLTLGGLTLTLWTPFTEMLWLAVSLRGAPIVGALLGIGAVLLLPLLDSLREPTRWWAPAVAILAAGILMGGGLMYASPSPERPRPSTLLWALDRDSQAALWATRPDGGREWAVQRTGVPLETERSLEEWGVHLPPVFADAYLTGPAPVVEIPPPSLEAAVLSEVGGRRTLRVALRSSSGAEMVGVRLPEGDDVFLRGVNGQPVPEPDPEQRSGSGRVREIHHMGEPDGPVTLELDIGPTVDTLDLEILEHHLRPVELLGERWFLRPPSIAPNVNMQSDRAVMRGTVRLNPATGAVILPSPAITDSLRPAPPGVADTLASPGDPRPGPPKAELDLAGPDPLPDFEVNRSLHLRRLARPKSPPYFDYVVRHSLGRPQT